MNCQTTQNILNAYADDELDLVNRLQTEQHLQDCSSCAREYENHLALKSAFADKSLYFRAPPNLQKRIQAALPETKRESQTNKIWQWGWLAAAASVAAIVVVSLIFFRSSSNSDDLLAKEIVSSHVRSMMANHLTDVPSTDQHTVKPWFEGKLDYAPPVTDFASQGFPLIGGRLDYVESRPVAAIVYQRHQHFINLFVYPATNNSENENKILARQGYNLIRWNKSGMSFWVVSDLNLNELQDFTRLIQNPA